MTVSVKLDLLDSALAKLRTVDKSLSDMRPMWDLIGADLVNATQMRFELGIGPDKSPWPPSLRALAGNGKTLIKDGWLKGDIQHNVFQDGVQVGSTKEYAAIHQFGGTINHPERQQDLHFKTDKEGQKVKPGFVRQSRSNFTQRVKVGAHKQVIPARPFLGLDDDDETRVGGIVDGYFRSFIQMD